MEHSNAFYGNDFVLLEHQLNYCIKFPQQAVTVKLHSSVFTRKRYPGISLNPSSTSREYLTLILDSVLQFDFILMYNSLLGTQGPYLFKIINKHDKWHNVTITNAFRYQNSALGRFSPRLHLHTPTVKPQNPCSSQGLCE